MTTWQPQFTPWRHGGWYVSNIYYPSGACGCVSNNYPDKKWRIVCDPRRSGLNEPGDFIFKTRDAAARAEFDLVEFAKAVKDFTPRQLEEAMSPRCPKPGEVELLYKVRNRFVEGLKESGSISIDDLANLDRLGRFKVADECWSICTEGARNALIDDPHHQVRSTASMASQVNLFAAA